MVRGLSTVCVACSRPRSPLAAVPVNVAGQPSKIGGTVASVAAWLVMAGGLATSAAVAALFQWLFPAGFIGWAFGGIILFLTLVVGIPLLLGGGALRRAGAARQRKAAEDAAKALATRSGGIVTAADLAAAIGVTEPEADALLTDLAKQGGDVKLEVDDDGRLFYTVGRGGLPPQRLRVGPGAHDRDLAGEAEAAAADEAREGDASRRERR